MRSKARRMEKPSRQLSIRRANEPSDHERINAATFAWTAFPRQSCRCPLCRWKAHRPAEGRTFVLFLQRPCKCARTNYNEPWVDINPSILEGSFRMLFVFRIFTIRVLLSQTYCWASL